MIKLMRRHRLMTPSWSLLITLLLTRVGLSAAPEWDNQADTWVATDALARKVPTFPGVPAARADRMVGIFYFLWHGTHIQGGPFDVTKILAADTNAMQKSDSPLWGPLHVPHHWGESIFGYYRTSDEGVLRKHAQMLSDAGVDVVIFDVTNQITYRDDYMALLRVWSEMRGLGNRTPQVAFLTPFWDPAKVVRELWRDLYSPGLHRELWFQWEGKPLILADPELSFKREQNAQQNTADLQEIHDFFTFRKPQPDYFQGQTKPDMWSWLEVSPQHVFTNSAGQKEQMSVGVAQNAVNGRLGSMSESGAHGRSFHHGDTDPRPDAVRYGLNVTEQWERGLKEDPRFIFATGWNEWIAGRFAEFNHIKQPVMFVDQFDHEHSRDIEPMRGGHGDDYYYQFVSYVRRYKGARPLPFLESRLVKVDGRFDDWRDVQPEFRDTIGDQVRREHRAWDTNVIYRNVTGRNDIVAAKVSWGKDAGWFYVRTREPITPAGGTNWMLLFLDTDADAKTGWLGYDFVINRAGAGTLERNRAQGFAWAPAGKTKWRVQGNDLELVIPWKALGLKSPPATLDFKWADNCLQALDWSDFTVNGDTAPNDRFNYRARLVEKISDRDRAALRERFDQIIVPIVDKAVRQPVTDQGGEIAWGESYHLSALVEMFEATRDEKYAALAVKLSDWIAQSRDDRKGLRDEVRGKVVMAWGSTNYTKGTRFAWAVHTGMIVAPMARFAAIARSDPVLKKRWGKDADRLLMLAKEAVAVHEAEYRDGPGAEEGYVYCPYLKKHLPLNMQNALARAWLAIDDATGTPKHRERITRVARFLKNRLRPMDDGSYVWAYWPSLEGPGDSFEDISHATINVDFMVSCVEHGLVFTHDDLARLEKTLFKRVLIADNRISDTVGGGDKFNKYSSAVLKWGRLGRHFPAVRERLIAFSHWPGLESETSAMPLGIAYLSLPPACSEGYSSEF